MVNLNVDFNGLKLKNTVLTASGTFGFGVEDASFAVVEGIGGFVVKGTTLHHREGNPYPRMAETASGMLNAVGLQNKGVDYFCKETYPQLKDLKTNVIVNVSGSCVEDYVETARRVGELPNIPAIELNISCPNVKEGGMAFGTDPKSAGEVVSAVRKAYGKHLMVKLSPNVTNIVSIAKAVEDAGADSVSLVNTFLGMAIDVRTRRPKLSTITGGMSGPAIKPIAVRMVWQVAQNVKIPVCGLGGIVTADDAIEFLLAGASCIQVGTANFLYPDATMRVLDGIELYCEKYGVKDISELIGGMKQ